MIITMLYHTRYISHTRYGHIDPWLPMMRRCRCNCSCEVWIKVKYWDTLLFYRLESQVGQLFVSFWQGPAVFTISQTQPQNMPRLVWQVLETVPSMQDGQIIHELNVTGLMI